MNREQLEGNWQKLKGKAKETWAELTDDDLDQIGGRAEQLEGKIRERYGATKEEAKQQVDSFCERCSD